MSTSKLQRYTGEQLRHRFAKYGIVENTRPDWLISSKGERPELDFYLERLGIAVEVQGKQHFEFTPIFHASEWDFREQIRRDKEKLEICQRPGIDLLYVCKRSDVEIALTACYDALKPEIQKKADWSTRMPMWLKDRIESEQEKARGVIFRRNIVSEKLILRWQKMLERERERNQPRTARIQKYEKKILKHLALLVPLE
jgi:hypothetical protein